MEKAERTQYMGAVKKGKADERREELLKEQLSFSLLRLYHLQLHCCRRANSYGCQRYKDMLTVKKGKEEKMNLQSCKTATLLALSSASTISSCAARGLFDGKAKKIWKLLRRERRRKVTSGLLKEQPSYLLPPPLPSPVALLSTARGE